MKLTVRQTMFSLGVNTITAAGTAAVLGFGGWHVMQGELTIGELMVVIAYIAAVYKPLETISTTIGSLQEISVGAGRLVWPAGYAGGDQGHAGGEADAAMRRLGPVRGRKLCLPGSEANA